MPRATATAAETQRRKQHTYMISYDIIIYSNSLSFNEHQLSGSIVYISSLTAQHAYKSLLYTHCMDTSCRRRDSKATALAFVFGEARQG